MTRERWQRLGPLVDAMLDQPPERRRAYIADTSNGDTLLAADLARFANLDSDLEHTLTADALFGAAEEERGALLANRLFDGTVDLFTELQSSLGASYVIEREIGGGGMSRLFLAEERDLERKVVVKVLPPELTQRVSAERCAREIRLAASMQQANIVPVLAAGTVAGFPYYTMPFVEGRSLRDRLAREGAPAINEAISILRDVARALAYAHGRGVIHRDIKPGNILLSDRTAVVVDFGIAKAVAAAEHNDNSQSSAPRVPAEGAPVRDDFTNGSLVIGTPAYMAPEQATAAAEVDHRADIYAFGCVAYELLTGKPAFSGASPAEIISARLRDTPPLVTTLRTDVPPAVVQLVAKCLEKNPARRPQNTSEILHCLDNVWGRRETSARRRPRLAVSGIALLAVAIAAWSYYSFNARSRDASLGTTSLPARDAYLIGQAQLRRRDIGQSIEQFQKAIDLDSTFARAHTALALALTLEPFFNGTAAADVVDRITIEARHGLALDSTLADAWLALGFAHGAAARWSAADSDMRRAIRLEPNDAMARQTFARQLLVRGYADEAFGQLDSARVIEPTSPLVSAWLSYAFFLKEQPDSALAQITRTIQLDSTLLAIANLGSLIDLARGRNSEARRLVRMPIGREMTNAVYVYAKLGDTASANRLLHAMELRRPRPWYIDVSKASVLLAIGDSANALTALERSVNESGPMWVFFIPLGDPAYDLVRASPRFAALLRLSNIDSRRVTRRRHGS